jgi:uncharacterized protein
MDIALNTQFILVGVAFFAGLISSIAGSGGILTLPALLWVGLPPLNALATNKVQSWVPCPRPGISLAKATSI